GLNELAFIGGLWGLFRGFRRLSALCFGVAAALANAGCAACCIYLAGTVGFVVMFVGSLLTLPVMIAAGVAWAAAATRRTATPRCSPLLMWPFVLTVALAPLSMLMTHWPLRLAFLASRPAMERLADRVAARQAIAGPEWAGLFRVVGSDVDLKTGNVG